MSLLWVAIFAVAISFGGVLLFGAPYLPTLRKQSDEAFELLALKEGETLLELGCGDGRVLVAAAKRGLNVVGIELNPFLALLCWFRTLRYRGRVRIIWGDFWRTDWPEADGIFVFLLQKYMPKLDKKITQESKKPVKLVSFAFTIESKKAHRQVDGLSLYLYK